MTNEKIEVAKIDNLGNKKISHMSEADLEAVLRKLEGKTVVTPTTMSEAIKRAAEKRGIIVKDVKMSELNAEDLKGLPSIHK